MTRPPNISGAWVMLLTSLYAHNVSEPAPMHPEVCVHTGPPCQPHGSASPYRRTQANECHSWRDLWQGPRARSCHRRTGWLEKCVSPRTGHGVCGNRIEMFICGVEMRRCEDCHTSLLFGRHCGICGWRRDGRVGGVLDGMRRGRGVQVFSKMFGRYYQCGGVSRSVFEKASSTQAGWFSRSIASPPLPRQLHPPLRFSNWAWRH